MAPKNNHKPMEETMVEKPPYNPNVPPKTSMEEWEDYEEQNNYEDHEIEKEQYSIVFFTP
jgi:hypothetical protein